MSQLDASLMINGATVHAVAREPLGTFYSVEPPRGYEYQCPCCKTKNMVLPDRWYTRDPFDLTDDVPLLKPRDKLVLICHAQRPSMLRWHSITCHHRADETLFRIRKRDHLLLK